MASFYGWGLSFINEMTSSDFAKYNEAITVLESRDMLMKMKIADYPNMKMDAKRKLHREVHKEAYPEYNERNAVTSEDMAKILSRMF